jgi:hypothetical protein
MKITMLQNKIILDGEGELNFIENEKTFIQLESNEKEYNYGIELTNFHVVGINSKFKIIRKLKKILYILKED